MIQSPYYPEYTPHLLILRDTPKSGYGSKKDVPHADMLFHVSAGDYLSTLATILRFFEETIADENVTAEMRVLQFKKIKELIADLLYLNKYYKVVPKDMASIVDSNVK